MELAHTTGLESSKFIKGEVPVDCDECPVRGTCTFRIVVDDITELVDDEIIDLACYGAFMRFLFSEV